ncbi:MAG TPA: hypothetical protein VMW03_05490 [Candidatus Krumholzibacteriaceae bacterium]|nr:hypothetical protein [Candidatus Krumholzibacteriaceae bacterium]
MKKVSALLLVALLAALASQLIVVYAQPKPRAPDGLRPRFNETDPEVLREFERRIEMFIKGRIIVSSVNILLYGYLTYFYIRLYMDNKSKFSLGLTALSIALLIYSIASNPYILQLSWRRNPIWMGVFNFIPDVFATLAALIMVYLSKT